MTRFAVFLDACVLVPVALTDTLLRLADRGLFRPLWSQQVLDEPTDAGAQIRPAQLAGMHPRGTALNDQFPDARTARGCPFGRTRALRFSSWARPTAEPSWRAPSCCRGSALRVAICLTRVAG